jgi:hypothetical protein
VGRNDYTDGVLADNKEQLHKKIQETFLVNL